MLRVVRLCRGLGSGDLGPDCRRSSVKWLRMLTHPRRSINLQVSRPNDQSPRQVQEPLRQTLRREHPKCVGVGEADGGEHAAGRRERAALAGLGCSRALCLGVPAVQVLRAALGTPPRDVCVRGVCRRAVLLAVVGCGKSRSKFGTAREINSANVGSYETLTAPPPPPFFVGLHCSDVVPNCLYAVLTQSLPCRTCPTAFVSVVRKLQCAGLLFFHMSVKRVQAPSTSGRHPEPIRACV